MKNSKQFAVEIPEDIKKLNDAEFELTMAIKINQALRSANMITQESYEEGIESLLTLYGLSGMADKLLKEQPGKKVDGKRKTDKPRNVKTK